MTATFNIALTSPVDHIRLALGDTDITAPLLQDETIAAKLTAFGYVEALAQLAEALAAQFAQEPDSIDEENGLKVSFTARVAQWRALAQAARSGAIQAPFQSQTPPRARIAAVGQTQIQAASPGDAGVMSGFRSW